MAGLPLSANVLSMTVMPSAMPFVGRGKPVHGDQCGEDTVGSRARPVLRRYGRQGRVVRWARLHDGLADRPLNEVGLADGR